MFKNIGLFLLNKRYNAMAIALLCALLPFVGIPTFWVSMLCLGLVTLYRGAKEGFWLLLWVALPGLAWGFISDASFMLEIIVLRAVVVWLLAIVLRRTASWAMILQVAALLGIAAVICMHLLVSDVASWWAQELTLYWSNIAIPLHLANNAAAAQQLLQFLSQIATGVLAVSVVVMDLSVLLLARAWQAVLFNPGGLSKELLQLRMNYIASAVLLLIILAAWLGSELALDVLPVVILPFTFAGLSLAHAQLKHKPGIRTPALIGLYSAILLFLPYCAILLAFLGFVDSAYDFRSLRTKIGTIAK